MTDKQKWHGPSTYRALLRKAKASRGERPGKLFGEAKALEDPYFASLALFELSADARLSSKKAVSAAQEALMFAGKVDRPWRRAELLILLLKKVGSWGGDGDGGGAGAGAAQYREKLLDGILDAVVSLPDGKGLSDAISGCAPRLECRRLLSLLYRAIANKGFELTCAKPVIRQWVQRCKVDGSALEEVLSVLSAAKDGVVRSKLMGHLHLQCGRSGRCSGSMLPLQAAVDAAMLLEKDECLDAMKYLAVQCVTREELAVVAGALDRLEDPVSRARIFIALGVGSDKAAMGDLALDLFKEGLRVIALAEDPRQRAGIRLNLAQGIGRCGDMGLAREAYLAALSDCGDSEKLVARIYRSMEGQGIKAPEVRKIKESGPVDVSGAPEVEKSGGENDLLALYNTYEGGLKSVHLRAISRAAPLCAAFGLDLALVGFPVDSLDDLVGAVITDTGVGRSGKYLRELMEQGRVALVCGPQKLDTLGLLVCTTSRPQEGKKVEMAEAILLARSHPSRRVCLIMGVGKRGLPRPLLDASLHHLDLTESNVPLETCTAMGVIAAEYKLKSESNRVA